MPRVLKRVFVLGLGWVFIVLGIAGLFLPILQGILFLLIGLALLSSESRIARLLMVRLRRRFPALARKLDEAGQRARRIFRRVRKAD